MRIGLISNARSERNKGGLADLDAAIGGRAGISHLRFDGQRPMTELLAELAAHGTELLAINGGDGTVQAALTSLLEDRPFDTLPLVAILPRGMANMTAADVGLKGRNAAAIERLLAAGRQGSLGGHVLDRRVLRVDNIAGWPAQRGMFFGAAGIYEAIRICKGQVHSAWPQGRALARGHARLAAAEFGCCAASRAPASTATTSAFRWMAGR